MIRAILQNGGRRRQKSPTSPAKAHEDDGRIARLEAFSDGVIAIIVTLTVFGLEPPHTADLPSLLRMWPVVATYGLSFLFAAITWVNHHNLLRTATRVDASVAWWNLALLFSMSFIPFGTAYLAQHIQAPLPIAFYHGLLFLCLGSFDLLTQATSRNRPVQDASSRERDHRTRRKLRVAMANHLCAIPIAYLSTWIALGVLLAMSALLAAPFDWEDEN